MEDEEEVQSHPSGDSGSPGSSTPPPPSQRSNGRITVTVATVPPQSQNNLTLALPIQRQQQQATPTTRATGNSGGGGGGGGREDCWSEGATSVLIDAWGERYLELSRGNLKQKHWKDVADIVSSREDYGKAPKTDIQCKNRIDTVKKKYKLEKAKIAAGGAPSKWPFYDRLDRLIGPSAKVVAAAGPSSLPLQYSGTSSQRVPMGIPMGARSAPPQFKQHHQQEKFAQQQQQQKQKQQLFRKRHIDSDDDEEEESEREPSPDSTDDFPPGSYDRKRPKIQQEFVNIGSSGMKPGMMTNRGKDEKGNNNAGEKNWGNAVKELTQAIMKFGEAYEQAETLKLQQLVDMEKQRMKFAKEMELQRMQFFMKTQLELSQLKSSSSSSGRRVGNSNNNINHRGSNNNNVANHNNNNTNNSDSSK